MKIGTCNFVDEKSAIRYYRVIARCRLLGAIGEFYDKILFVNADNEVDAYVELCKEWDFLYYPQFIESDKPLFQQRQAPQGINPLTKRRRVIEDFLRKYGKASDFSAIEKLLGITYEK